MSKKRILIVEDEASVRKIIHAELAKHDIDIDEAPNGEEAFQIAIKRHPDVVVLDFLMPKMHGIEFMQKVKSEEWGKKVAVLILTNLPDEPRLVELQKQGQCEILSKADASLDDIVQAVKKHL